MEQGSWVSLVILAFWQMLWPGLYGCVAYRQDHALLCFMDRLLTACEGNLGLAVNRTFSEETALSVCRYLFQLQTLVLYTHLQWAYVL
jgi:hypothetical protein